MSLGNANPFAALPSFSANESTEKTIPTPFSGLNFAAPARIESNSDSDAKNKNRREDYERHLKGLNVSFLRHLESTLQSDPTVDFTSILPEYQSHRRSIQAQFQDVVALSSAPVFSFTLPSAPSVTSMPGKGSVLEKPSLPTWSPSTMPSLFPSVIGKQSDQIAATFSASSAVAADEEGADDGDGATADLPEEKTVVRAAAGEENEKRLIELRSKLFTFRSGSWVDLGVGTMKVVDEEDKIDEKSKKSKKRLMFRADGTGKALLNCYAFEGMQPALPEGNKKDVSIVAFDLKGQLAKYLVRLKTPDEASSLYKVLSAAINDPVQP